jgi:DNA-binding NtrC family response regulator
VDEQRAEFFRTYASVFRRGPTSRELEKTAVNFAQQDDCLVITGESGVGKKTVARAVHYLSERSGAPLSYVDCAGLPADQLEHALFGGEANEGTLVLAEYDLLTLQQQLARRIGEHRDRKQARVIATTTRLASGGDRPEPLSVSTIAIPPLRAHADDIPGLAEFFRVRFMEHYRRDTPRLSDSMMARLRAYPWPGNVLELEHLIKRYVVFGEAGNLLEELGARTRLAAASAPRGDRASDVGLREVGRRAAREAETAAILVALEQADWNRAEAARLLKVSYKTLLNKLSRSGIVRKSMPSRPSENDRS